MNKISSGGKLEFKGYYGFITCARIMPNVKIIVNKDIVF